jgi:general secretion pathway protein A
VIDEAQSLSSDILEEIRLLANIDTDGKTIAARVGRSAELAQRLEEPGLRQLKQRIALRCELKPLELSDTAAYIASRIRTAGGDPANIFTRQAVTLIHEFSRGLPRTISVMCDNALMSGFALDQRPVDGDIVMEVCRDFDLGGGAAAAAPVVAKSAVAAPSVTNPAMAAPSVAAPSAGTPAAEPSRRQDPQGCRDPRQGRPARDVPARGVPHAGAGAPAAGRDRAGRRDRAARRRDARPRHRRQAASAC